MPRAEPQAAAAHADPRWLPRVRLPASELPAGLHAHVVMRVTPMAGPLPPALHAAEEHARRTAALALHPQAIAVSTNSQCWDIHIPHSV